MAAQTDSSLPMSEVDSNAIAVEFIADNQVSRQYEFISAMKRSLAITLCQCSSFIAISCQVTQSIQQFNTSAISSLRVKVCAKSQAENGADPMPIAVFTFKGVQCLVFK